MGFFTNQNKDKENQPAPVLTSTKKGLLIGVSAGAVAMMIAGGLGYTRFADIALLIGMTLGFGGGVLYDQIKQKKQTSNEQKDAETSEYSEQ